MRTNADREAWARGQRATKNPDGSYRSQWWTSANEHGAFSARGIHGQSIYIDPAADVVIVKLSSFPEAWGTAGRNQLLGFEAIAKELMEQ